MTEPKKDANEQLPEDDDKLAEALAQLSPEEAAMFVRALELTMKRRRLLFTGYIAAIMALIGGMGAAIYVYGTRDPGTFVGWILLLPFAAVGIILISFGRLAKSSTYGVAKKDRSSPPKQEPK